MKFFRQISNRRQAAFGGMREPSNVAFGCPGV